MDREIRSRFRIAYAVFALVGALLLALPASGLASQGGAAGLAPGSSGLEPAGGSGSSAGPAVAVGSAGVPVSASGDGITLSTQSTAMLRGGLSFSGAAPSSLAGDTVEIERSGHQTDWRWAPTVAATVASDGSFQAVWHTNHIGRFAIRALVSRPGAAQAASATPTVTITVYRPSRATQYGPGFYGRRTACGQKLGKATIGLANRTLKCGTKVALMYDGRTLIVPVIDRGPYANGADWDLTMATGRALGITGTAQIGAVSLPAR